MERDLTKEFLENCLKTAQFSEKKIDEILSNIEDLSFSSFKNFDFDDLLLGDGECILGKGKKTFEEFLNQ